MMIIQEEILAMMSISKHGNDYIRGVYSYDYIGEYSYNGYIEVNMAIIQDKCMAMMVI